MTDTRPAVVCIAGTTASGKSGLALAIARELGAEILCVDSMQVYRGFDIGTAKATAAERAEIPHHGIDFVDPREYCSAGMFLEQARAAVEDCAQRGVPILAVGGTGLYLKGMLHGLAPTVTAAPLIRAEMRALEEQAQGAMHAELKKVDPAAADRLHPHDLIRIERAIEVFRVSGRLISEVQADHRFRPSPFRFRLFALRRSREELRIRVRKRLGAMLASGWPEEVTRLLAAGIPEGAPAMRALGYRDVAAHLRGEFDEAELVARIETQTMRFAKRQTTWLNREPSVEWVDPSADSLAAFVAEVRAFL
jgi:tRNA dimethylallyltransferase